MTTIYLIRHAEGEGNSIGVFQGLSDWKISENGWVQLNHLAERCAKMRIDVIYSSPLRRAMDTAMAVNRAHDLPILVEEDLREIDGGAFDGCRWADIAERYPTELDTWKTKLWAFTAPGGESIAQVYDRVWGAVTRIAENNPGRVIAVVGHGCAIKNALCRAYGWPVEKIHDVPWTDNTCLNRIDFDEDLRPTVVYINSVEHLPEETVRREWKIWDRVGMEESVR